MDRNDAPRTFETTRWSVILLAGNKSSPEAELALTTLCETYWFPLYSYVRRRGHNVNEAQDLTQEFFACLLEKDYVASADQERGRFRAFLLTALKNFLSKQRDKERAQKRGGGRTPLSLDLALGESQYVAEPSDSLTAEQLYERQWTVGLLNRVMEKLAEEMREAGKEDWFEQLKRYIVGGADGPTYAKTAETLGITESAAKTAAHRMRKRYGRLLRNEIAETVEHVADVEDEIRTLFTAFSG